MLIQSSSDVIQVTPRDLLEVSIGLVIRFTAKMFKKAFNGLLQDKWVKVNFMKILNNEERALINLIHVQEVLVSGHSDITKKLK
jgi:hypothetical protein